MQLQIKHKHSDNIQIKLFKLMTVTKRKQKTEFEMCKVGKVHKYEQIWSILTKTNQCFASPVGCQHDAIHICCWAPSPLLSIDISCLRGAQQQTRRTPKLLLSIDSTDRRTLARFVDSAARTVQNVSIKIWKYELAVQNSMLFCDWVLTIVPRTCVRLTRHKIAYFRDALSSQSLGSVLRKLYPKTNLDNTKSK